MTSYRKFDPYKVLAEKSKSLSDKSAIPAIVATEEKFPHQTAPTIAGIATIAVRNHAKDKRQAVHCFPQSHNKLADLYRHRYDAAVNEHSLTSEEAHTLAYQCCLIDWLNSNPEPSAADVCAWCDKPDHNGAPILPFCAGDSGHTWLHSGCWGAWSSRRKREARAALQAAGINPPGDAAE